MGVTTIRFDFKRQDLSTNSNCGGEREEGGGRKAGSRNPALSSSLYEREKKREKGGREAGD